MIFWPKKRLIDLPDVFSLPGYRPITDPDQIPWLSNIDLAAMLEHYVEDRMVAWQPSPLSVHLDGNNRYWMGPTRYVKEHRDQLLALARKVGVYVPPVYDTRKLAEKVLRTAMEKQ